MPLESQQRTSDSDNDGGQQQQQQQQLQSQASLATTIATAAATVTEMSETDSMDGCSDNSMDIGSDISNSNSRTAALAPTVTPPPHQVLDVQRMKIKALATRQNKNKNNPQGTSSNAQNNPNAVANSNEPVPNALVMVGLVFAGLLMALLVMAFFAYAPLLCASWLGIVYVVGLYLSTESNWWWHDAQEFENRFWTFTAFMFSAALLYIRDSPFAVGQWNSTLGMFLVLLFTSSVHFLDRFIHRREISRKPRLNPPSAFSQNLFKYRATAEEKAQLLTESVGRIDRIYLPSTINNMINLSEVRRHEQKIFRILAGASKDELNFILNNIRLALLFYKVKDHSAKLRSEQSRTLLVDLLCTTRLGDLTVTSRAILLDALMVMKLSAHPQNEKWVRNILLKTSGDDLSNLKTYTDAKGDFHSMHKLVFNDIRDPTIRADILNHIKREADIQTAHMKLGTKRARNRRHHAWRKVLSDVDDTLYSSGGRFPAGLDTRFPRHTIYPGVLSFYREMDMGTAGPDDWTDDRVGNLVFLSARPHVYKDMSEKKSYAKFAALYEMKGMHTLPTMLAGTLTSGRAFMVQGDLEPMAQKKFENFGQFYQLYPEFTHVFVGDNGQADIRAAELMVQKYGSHVLEAAFFHLVHPIEQTFGYRDKRDVERWRAMNIVFFNTYVGAAVEAFMMRKLRLVGLSKISAEAVATFQEIHVWPTTGDRERARLLLNTDLERANALLEKGGMDTIALVPQLQLFALNSHVRSPFGRAIVRQFRAVEGIYHIELVDWTLSKHQRRRRVRAYVPETSLVAYVNGDATQIAASAVKYIQFKRAPLAKVLPPQTLVKTPFGTARVLKYRSEDAIYTVAIDSSLGAGAGSVATSAPMQLTGYFAADAVIPLRGLDGLPADVSPRMFSGVRSGIGYITKKLSTFVPGGSSSSLINVPEGAKPLFSVGATVETPFGRAVVLHMRSRDRVYALQLVRSDVAIGGVYVQETNLRESHVAPPPRSFFAMLGIRSSSRSSGSITGGNGTGSATSSPPSSVLPSRAAIAVEPPVVGTHVLTLFGAGVVRSVRVSDGVFEVELSDWRLALNARVTAFLTQAAVQTLAASTTTMTLDDIPTLSLTTKSIAAAPTSSSSKGLFQLFRYGFSSSAHALHDTSSSNRVDATADEMLDRAPYASDATPRRVTTVFGEGTTAMATPHAGVLKVVLANPDLRGAIAFVQASDVSDVAAPTHVRKNTLELFGNPFSYLRWSSSNVDEHGVQATSALFQPLPLDDEAACDKATQAPLYPRGTLVRTPFGEGVVQQHRARDDIFTIDFPVAPLRNNSLMRGFFPAASLERVVRGIVGLPVDTIYGSGLLCDVRATDGVHVVTLRPALVATAALHVTAFLQPASVTGALTAARGDVVQTPFGKGVVLSYRSSDAFYCVALEWGESTVPRGGRRSHVTAFIRAADIVRSGAVEKHSSGCAVM